MDGLSSCSEQLSEHSAEKLGELTEESRDSESSPEPRKRKRGWFRILFSLVVVLMFAGGLAWLAAHEAQRMPQAYEAVLRVESDVAARNGSKLEHNLVRLQNAARTKTPWQIEFTQDQINGWFVSDLPEKFPDAMPEMIRNPRVVIEDQELKFIFKLVTESLEGFVVAQAEIFCTQVENEVAVRIVDVRSGFVPLPIGPWVQRIESLFQNIGIPVRWTELEQDPVAVFTIPKFMTPQGTNRNAVIDFIRLDHGKLVVAGQTQDDVREIAKAENDSERH